MINIDKLPEKLKAVLFDMDGVLYDSMKNHAYSWTKSFKKWGIDFPAYDAYMNEGRTGNATIEMAFKEHLNRAATEKEIEDLYQYKTELMLEAPEAEILPGMQEVVQKTREAGLKVIVVTGSRQPSLIQRLQKDFNIRENEVVSGFDVKIGKPHPEPYLMGLKKANCTPQETLVIENAPMGVESSVAAGIATIAVNTGILRPEELSSRGAFLVLPDTKSLLEIWDKVLQQV